MGFQSHEVLHLHMIIYPLITIITAITEDVLLTSLNTPKLFTITDPLPTLIIGFPWLIAFVIVIWSWYFHSIIIKNKSIKALKSGIGLHCMLFVVLKLALAIKQARIPFLKNKEINTSGTVTLLVYTVVTVLQLWQFVIYTTGLLTALEKLKRKQKGSYTQFLMWVPLDSCMYIHILAMVVFFVFSAVEWIYTLIHLERNRREIPFYWMLMVILGLTGLNNLIFIGAVHHRNVKLLDVYKCIRVGLYPPINIIFAIISFFRNETRDNDKIRLNEVLVHETFVVVIGNLIALEYYAGYLYRKRFLLKGQVIDEEHGNSFKRLKGFLKSIKVPSLTVDIDKSDEGYLREGEFGNVHKGTIKSLRGSSKASRKMETVAVKFLNKKYICEQDQIINSLFSEIKTLYFLKPGHKNLVNLLGIVVENNTTDENDCKARDFAFGMVLEYCCNGSLHRYLHTVKNNEEQRPQNLLTKMLVWSLEIASAMEYLENSRVRNDQILFKLRIIHGDLAARNVLLDEHECVKVTDFGLSSRLYYYQLYVHSKQTACPWRWMAPESLADLKFSVKSDVYSYGILLWEMYALGQLPWGHLQWNSKFVKDLQGGLKLNKPDLAPKTIYENIMALCWSVDESKRLSFKDIVAFLTDLTIRPDDPLQSNI